MMYREVKASERLPDEGEHMTNEGWLEYDTTHEVWGFISGLTAEWVTVNDVVWWLEPIEITEEEIEEILYDNSAGEWEHMGYTMLDELRVEPTIEAILSKLKGE